MNQGVGKAPKRLLFVVTKSNFGGAQRYVYDLATNLPRDQFEVTVAFGGEAMPAGRQGTLAHMLREKGVRAISLPSLTRDVSFGNDLAAFKSLVELLKKELPDVVHLNSSKAGGLGALAAHIAGIRRIVFTAHGWPFWEKRNIPARVSIFLLSYITVLLSHYTICISQFDRRAMARGPFMKRKLRVVHNGIPGISFVPREQARGALFSPAEIDAHGNDVWLLSNGELTANKNYFVGIDAVAAYNATASRKIFYSIMSDGEQRKEIERHIARKHLSDQVKLLGFVPDGRRFMRAFDIFFLPSKKEGVPYVILEAGAAGLPVLASRVGGIPEVITDGESGLLVEPHDVAEFARALASMAQDAQKRGRFAAALRAKIERDFSLASMLEQTIALY